MEKKEVKQEDPKKKGFLGKIKEGAEDHEDQLAILGTFVRLGILIWSGGILTLAYVKLPVSYTHLRAPRDGLLSRMPSSA